MLRWRLGREGRGIASRLIGNQSKGGRGVVAVYQPRTNRYTLAFTLAPSLDNRKFNLHPD